MIEKFKFYIQHSINDLRVNGQRTAFALLCIAAGVAAIVSLQSLGVMIEDTLTGSLRESNRGDIRISALPEFDADVDTSRRDRDGILEEDSTTQEYRITSEGLETLRQWLDDNYEGEYRFSYQQALAGSTAGVSISIPERDTDKPFVQPYIIEAAQYPLFGTIKTKEDELLADVLQSPTDIVFSQTLADDLDAKVGDKIRLNLVSEDFTLVGIVPNDSEVGFDNLIGNIFGYYYVDTSAIQYYANAEPNTAVAVYIGLEKESDADPLNDKLTRRYPYLNTTTTSELRELNSEISGTVNDLVVIMGLISMLIGGIGIVNTMLVIVSRRTTEVAVLKTIGLEPNEVTQLFLVEAIIMGVVGSILGIFIGWAAAFALKGIGGRFIGQSLAFSITLDPALTGFIIGVLVTTIFGFIPTLAAGQVRPANVLRPSDEVIPTAGRLQSFAALMVVLFAISLVTQGLIGGLLDTDDSTFKVITGINGAIIGLLMSLPIVLGGFLSMRRGRKGRSWLMRALVWVGLLIGLPAAGFAFGYMVPSIIVVTFTFILIGSLYLLLMLLIWAVGGGSIREFPVLGNLPVWIRIPAFIFFPAWTAFLVFIVTVVQPSSTVLSLFLGLLFFIHIPAIIITLVLPAWVLGQLLQRFGFLDLKIALRAMVATKGRGATTLLALVIGIFTLSVITMLVDTILDQFETVIEEQTGGNLLIFTAGDDSTITAVTDKLDTLDGVEGYSRIRSYDAQMVELTDVSAGRDYSMNALRQKVIDGTAEGGLFTPEDLADQLEFSLEGLDARDVASNLPDVDFYQGRQLDPIADTQPDAEGIYPIVISTFESTVTADIEVGDLITFSINGDRNDTVTFRIVGMVDKRGGAIEGFGANNYTTYEALGDHESDSTGIIAQVDEEHLREVRRSLGEIPAVFVLETRLINELLNSIIRQFTSFPILVAALSLVVGGIVIANSVALSTLERRREIGIMKAIGLQRERVLGMLLLENGLMGFVGGLIGVGMAVLALIVMLVALFQGELGSSIPIVTALLLMLLCIVIALVAAVISVWGASGEKPLNVLRYE